MYPGIPQRDRSLYSITEPRVEPRAFLVQCWKAAVRAVEGENAVRVALDESGPESISHLLAVGKAASTMCKGALPILNHDGRCLVITKDGHVDDDLRHRENVVVIESSHPIPDQRSLDAGAQALEFVQSMPAESVLLMLVSGGASALMEMLPSEIGLVELQEMTDELISKGYHIGQINAVRKSISLIKGGKLLSHFGGRKVTVFAISDIPNDDLDLVGSGIGSEGKPSETDFEINFSLPDKVSGILGGLSSTPTPTPMPTGFSTNQTSHIYNNEDHTNYCGKIIASNSIARQAAAKFAKAQCINVVMERSALNDDVFKVAQNLSDQICIGAPGLYVFGGEPTINLPEVPGTGGRNQSLALAIAKLIRGAQGITVIAAGTAGTDGPTDAAGGIVDGDTFDALDGADEALAGADAGTWLQQVGGLFVSGPTGTNVMDLVIALKQEDRKHGE